MKDFWIKFSYLLDSNDRKNFLKFIVLLFFGGVLSLLGIGAVIPFIGILVDPQQVQHLPLFKNTHFTYHQLLAIIILFLISSFWIKNISAFIILKKQAAFLGSLVAKIQKKLFFSYLHSPYIYHIKRSSPELINNINVEVNMLSSNVIIQLGTVLNEGFASILIGLFLLLVNPIFSIIVLGAMLITSFFFIRKLKVKINYYGKTRSECDAKLTKSVIQGLGGIQETKIYQKEAFFIDKVNRYSDRIAKAGAFASIFQQSSRFLIETMLITVVLTLLLIFILLGHTGYQMLVLLSVFGIAAVQLLPSISRLLQALTNIKYGYVALDKIYHELSRYDEFQKLLTHSSENKKEMKPLAFSQYIYLQNVYFDYEGKTILNNVNLAISKGKKVAFVGSSGAGKTTLINIILGILTPSQGELRVDDNQITQHNMPLWYKHFGYIPQLIFIYDCNLRENIAFGVDPQEIDEDQVWNCLKMASLDEFVKNACSDGLNTLIGENGIRLSGGERQRVGIARALYHNPDILIMDEATASLDNETEHSVAQALSKAGEGRTTLTIAHRLSTIKDYDIIYMMKKGEIIASGNYEYLQQHCPDFQKIANIQG